MCACASNSSPPRFEDCQSAKRLLLVASIVVVGVVLAAVLFRGAHRRVRKGRSGILSENVGADLAMLEGSGAAVCTAEAAEGVHGAAAAASASAEAAVRRRRTLVRFLEDVVEADVALR